MQRGTRDITIGWRERTRPRRHRTVGTRLDTWRRGTASKSGRRKANDPGLSKCSLCGRPCRCIRRIAEDTQTLLHVIVSSIWLHASLRPIVCAIHGQRQTASPRLQPRCAPCQSGPACPFPMPFLPLETYAAAPRNCLRYGASAYPPSRSANRRTLTPPGERWLSTTIPAPHLPAASHCRADPGPAPRSVPARAGGLA